ncbi:MAG: metallophosphoesterase [Chloroflexota bacterium]|nr:MAG: metallophosphoesterase [Chloroflexota bacterium]
MTNQLKQSEYPPEDVLVKSGLHRMLVLFHGPADWPAWQVLLALLIPLAAVVLAWTAISSQFGLGLLAAGLLALFFFADALLLRSLPRRGVSYGPWQSQLFALTIPRTTVALACSLIAVLLGPFWGFSALLGLQLLGSATLVYGTLVEPFRLGLTYLTVETDRLAAEDEPIRILHISDLHVERLTRREEQLLAMLKDVEVDIILITGDYLNLSYVRDHQAQDDVRHLLAQISAPYGVYATLGSPPVDQRNVIPPLFDDLPVLLLVNESRLVELDGGRRLVLLGLDCSHHLATDAMALDRLMSTSPNGMPSVLMYHAPDLMPEAAAHDIDLYLCGHTHGGQVRLPIIGAVLTSSQLGKRYEMGLYQEGRTHMYVSRGVGLEGLSAPRVRFLAPPEITLITVHGRRSASDRQADLN